MRPKRLAAMTGIGVDQMSKLADALARPEVLRFENLDTDLAPPEVALNFTRSAVEQDQNNSYLPFVGQIRLPRAVAAHVARLSGVPYDADRNVIISAGGLSGILNVLLTIIDTGDEVILTDPTYIGLINRVRLADVYRASCRSCETAMNGGWTATPCGLLSLRERGLCC